MSSSLGTSGHCRLLLNKNAAGSINGTWFRLGFKDNGKENGNYYSILGLYR